MKRSIWPAASFQIKQGSKNDLYLQENYISSEAICTQLIKNDPTFMELKGSLPR
jgi:hypothetical protein